MSIPHRVTGSCQGFNFFSKLKINHHERPPTLAIFVVSIATIFMLVGTLINSQDFRTSKFPFRLSVAATVACLIGLIYTISVNASWQPLFFGIAAAMNALFALLHLNRFNKPEIPVHMKRISISVPEELLHPDQGGTVLQKQPSNQLQEH